MEPAPVVSIIIPIFNQWRYTHACLQALLDTASPDIPFEVVVIDNGSTDESGHELLAWQKRWPALRVETFDANQGFSPACNRGAQLARAPYLLFLNNDTVPQPRWLEPLLEEALRPEVGISAPKLLYPESLCINHAGYVFGRLGFIGIYHGRPGDLDAANKIRDYQALLGACILMKRELFFSVGQFSLDGYEDVDLCLKVGARSLRCRYVPRSVVLHHNSITLTQSPPGSFPVTTGVNFGEKWGNYPLRWDEYYWYLEDGQWTGPSADNKGKELERAEESVGILLQAIGIFGQGHYDEALGLIDQALGIWPTNPMAYVERCKALYAANKLEELVLELKRADQFLFYPSLMMELAPVLSKIVPEQVC